MGANYGTYIDYEAEKIKYIVMIYSFMSILVAWFQ